MEGITVIAETDRLILRRYRESDLQDLYEYLSNPEVVKFEPYRPMSMDEVRHNLEWRISTDEMTAVELKESHKMIGNVYLGNRDFESLEIGYVFNQDYWGKGYAKESCKALLEYHSSKGVKCFTAGTGLNNIPSVQLLKSLGFTLVGTEKVSFYKDEQGKDIYFDGGIYELSFE